MSIPNLNKYWKTKDVLPYLENFFKYHNAEKMYIVGSRGKTPIKDWDNMLIGKDWDILVQINSYVKVPNLLVHKKFNVDILRMGKKDFIESFRQIGYDGCTGGFELFPETPKELEIFKIIK